MATRRTNPNQSIIRFPSISNPYTYFKILAEYTEGQPYKKKAYESATGILNSIGDKLGSKETIEGSLQFLQQAAAHERAKEIAFFDDKISKLNGLNGETIDELREFLIRFQSNPSGANYQLFIKKLNQAFLGVERTAKRLQSFLNNYEENYSNSRKELNTMALRQADTLLNSIKEQRDRIADDLDELIRVFVIKFMENHGTEAVTAILTKKKTLATESFTAAAIYLQQSIFKFLIDNPDILNYNKFQEVDLQKSIDEIYPKFEKAFLMTSEATIFQQGGAQLESILNEVSNFFEIKTLQRQNPKNRKAAGRNNISDSLDNLLSLSDKTPKYLKNALKRTQIKTKFHNTALGNFKELDTFISGIFKKGKQLGSLGGATDSIYVGDFEINYQIPSRDTDLFSEEEKLLNELKKELSKSKNSVDNSKKFTELVTKLNKLYNEIKEIKQGFVIHESTKFYQTIEKGKWYNNVPGFKGRGIQILNYIDDISTLGNSFGIDTDWLKFAAINLSDAALGSNLTAPLETYFTTFIGLIMFDDFELIGKELAGSIQNNKVSTIHLYKLQDMFFPSSYFLEQTYNRMLNIFDSLQSANSFYVKIKTPKADKILEKKGESYPADWENVRGYAQQNTIVNTTFALNFLELMQNLFNS